jgi:hypothetical protein
MRHTVVAPLALAALTALTACGDDADGGGAEGPAVTGSRDPSAAAYCDLVEESVKVQSEIGPDGPTPEQNQKMAHLAVRLSNEAPADLRDAYDASEQLGEDASTEERAEAIRAYNEALNEWTKANCA